MDCSPKPFTVGKLFREQADIQMNPTYQRTAGIWSKAKQQLFIDSLLNGFDTPKIYFHNIKSDSTTPEKWAVVDGVQRLSTIFKFMQSKLCLDEEGFVLDESVAERVDSPRPQAGDHYMDLDPAWQDYFRDISLTVTEIDDAEIQDIEDLFFRLNNGQPLHAAEQRTAMGGDMVTLIKTIADHKFFTEHVKFANTRQQHREAAAKLLQMAERLKAGDDHFADLKKKHLDNLVKKGRDLTGPHEKKLKAKVNPVLKRMQQVFPDKPDPRLSAQASVPLYFIFVDLVIDSYGHERLVSLVDEFVTWFEQERLDNRTRDEDDRDPSMSEFDRLHQQGTNDAGSLRDRTEIMISFLLKRNPEITLKDKERLFTDAEKRAMWLIAKGKCQHKGCGARLPSWSTGEADHIDQWSHGGQTTIENGRILCKSCNAKLAKTLR